MNLHQYAFGYTRSATYQPRILIGIPAQDVVKTPFTMALVNLIQYSSQRALQFEITFSVGSVLPAQRETIANQAISGGFTHILWLDSDMVFPANMLETFLSRCVDVVCADYSTRDRNPRPTSIISDRSDHHPANISDDVLQQVDAVGMGCMLTAVSAIATIPRPLFNFEYVRSSEGAGYYHGEDIYFCQRLHAHGVNIFVDPVVSREVSHIGSAEFKLSMG
jgi:hypothetical protein